MPEQEAVQAKPVAAWRDAFAAKAAAWILMLAASLFNLLNFNGYPLFRPEVGVVLVVLAAIGGAFALIERGAPKLAFAFTGFLVLLGVDLNTENAWIPLAIGAAALAAAWFNNTAVVKIALAAFGTAALFQLGTGLFGSPAAPAKPEIAAPSPADASRPPIVHLLMDSYVGTEGMGAEPALRPLRRDTEQFFTRRGFRLYDGAYSRHANTANSVPYILSFGTAKLATGSQRIERAVPDKFAYFENLAKRGYKVSVLGVNFIDLCTGQAVAECEQFPHSDLSALTKFDLSTGDRALTIGITLAGFASATTSAYDLSQLIKVAVFGEKPHTMRNLKKVGSLRSAIAMRDFAATFGQVENGRAYFVHLLMPHEPYVFDADCNMLPRKTWSNEQTPGTRAERLADYGAQLTCTNKLLGALLDGLDASPVGKNAIVIIHGDHGSRIVEQRPTVEHPSPARPDFAMTYSALFAIRAPQVESGVVAGRASLDELLKDFATGDFAAAPLTNRRPAEVILATQDWVAKKRAPLPEYGGR